MITKNYVPNYKMANCLPDCKKRDFIADETIGKWDVDMFIKATTASGENRDPK
jgi:hypothetical protein